MRRWHLIRAKKFSTVWRCRYLLRRRAAQRRQRQRCRAKQAGGFPTPQGAGEGAWVPQAAIRILASIAKTPRATVLPISSELAAELRALIPVDAAPFQLVFPHMVPRVSTIKRDLAQAGIPFVDELGRRIDLHALRKTFGTALVLNGEHPRVVIEAMRHSDVRHSPPATCRTPSAANGNPRAAPPRPDRRCPPATDRGGTFSSEARAR